MSALEHTIAPIETVETGTLSELQASHAELVRRMGALETEQPDDRLSIVVFSGEFDKLYAAFILATGAAAMGSEVNMFFTFWGLSAVKKETIYKGKNFWERMLTFMMPKGPSSVPTSNMNMMGVGPKFFNLMMRKKGAATLPALIELAQELEVEMNGCQMSMDIMGYKREELLDGLDYCGVAAFLGSADKSKNTLFI